MFLVESYPSNTSGVRSLTEAGVAHVAEMVAPVLNLIESVALEMMTLASTSADIIIAAYIVGNSRIELLWVNLWWKGTLLVPAPA